MKFHKDDCASLTKYLDTTPPVRATCNCDGEEYDPFADDDEVTKNLLKREKELIDYCQELTKVVEKYELSGNKIYNDRLDQIIEDICYTIKQYNMGE